MSQEKRNVARAALSAPATNTLGPPTALVLLDRPVGDDVYVLVTERGKEKARTASDVEPLPPPLKKPQTASGTAPGPAADPRADTTPPLKLTFVFKAGEDPTARDRPPRQYSLFQVRSGVRSMLFQKESSPLRMNSSRMSWEVDAEHLLARRWSSGPVLARSPPTPDDVLHRNDKDYGKDQLDYSSVTVEDPDLSGLG